VGRLVERADRLLGICERLFLALANGSLAILLTINILNIASRAIWDRGLQWVFPWSTVLFVWMSFFGFYVVYRMRSDITVDFVYDRLGVRGQIIVRQIVNLVILHLMAVMVWHGPEIIERQAGIIEQVYFFGIQVERFTLAVPLFVTCGLIFLNYLVDLIYGLRGETMPSYRARNADAR
jgi:TRAP-type C4-dicarboxylate transport system permease small subunit